MLSGSGLVALVGVLVCPQRAMILALRGVMGLVTLGSFFGMFEHIEHNLEFALEIRPNAVASDVFVEALGGPNPLLAPGILAWLAPRPSPPLITIRPWTKNTHKQRILEDSRKKRMEGGAPLPSFFWLFLSLPIYDSPLRERGVFVSNP